MSDNTCYIGRSEVRQLIMSKAPEGVARTLLAEINNLTISTAADFRGYAPKALIPSDKPDGWIVKDGHGSVELFLNHARAVDAFSAWGSSISPVFEHPVRSAANIEKDPRDQKLELIEGGLLLMLDAVKAGDPANEIIWRIEEELRVLRAAPTTSPEPATCKDSLQVQSSPEPDAVRKALDVEELAKWLHNETEHPEHCPGYTWPENEYDDGRRGGGGWVKIVPVYAQEYFRDIARRMIAGPLAALSAPVAGADRAEISDEDMRDLLSSKDVGSGRAKLRRLLGLKSTASPSRNDRGEVQS